MALVRSIVIGATMGDADTSKCGDMGIETPWEVFAFTVHDIAFFNWDQTNRKKSKYKKELYYIRQSKSFLCQYIINFYMSSISIAQKYFKNSL